MEKEKTPHLVLAHAIAERYGKVPEVEAVVLAGSLTSGVADRGSDIDLYVYTRAEIPLEARTNIAKANSEYAEVNNQFWEPGDEWIDTVTGIHVDVMFRSVDWIEKQLNRILKRHEASVGYSTCFWHNVILSQALYDRSGWYRKLQQEARQPYPEALKRAIIAKNHPILRQTVSSYMNQLKKAVARNDWISINHRVAALLASYFDILFAVNKIPHPGEKRLAEIAIKLCKETPPGMEQQLNDLMHVISKGDRVIEIAETLIGGLDILLRSEESNSK